MLDAIIYELFRVKAEPVLAHAASIVIKPALVLRVTAVVGLVICVTAPAVLSSMILAFAPGSGIVRVLLAAGFVVVILYPNPAPFGYIAN